jgi:hypothetical protein
MELPPPLRRAAAWFESGRKHHVAYLTGVGGSPQNCRSRLDSGTRLNLGGGAHAMGRRSQEDRVILWMDMAVLYTGG